MYKIIGAVNSSKRLSERLYNPTRLLPYPTFVPSSTTAALDEDTKAFSPKPNWF